MQIGYLIIAIFLLTGVFIELGKRLRRKPLAFLISDAEKSEENKTEEEIRRIKQASFRARAHRVNWSVPVNYQQTWAGIGLMLGATGFFLGESLLYLLAGIAFGLLYPFLQLTRKEEAFQAELPLRAEQAINAIEQQMQGNTPIFHAIKAAVPYMQSPLKEEYQRAVDRVEKANMSLKRALSDIPIRLGLRQLEYFHMIVEVAEDTQERARDIVRSCSDMLRRQQKNSNRYLRETSESRKEMVMMFGLVAVMIAAFNFLVPESMPVNNGTIYRILDVVILGLSGWTTWVFRKKLNPKNLF